MRQPDLPKKPNLYGWLWWLALLIAAIGFTITYVLKLDTLNPDLDRQLTLTAIVSIIGSGVCVIAATASWWMQR